jgi:hypothetical protein
MSANLINKENMERQITEMWDAVNQIPTNEPDRDEALNTAQKTENDLRGMYRKQEQLRDAGPILFDAITGDDVPQLYRISWLKTLMKECKKPEVFTALCKVNDDDAGSIGIMLDEINEMVRLIYEFLNPIENIKEWKEAFIKWDEGHNLREALSTRFQGLTADSYISEIKSSNHFISRAIFNTAINILVDRELNTDDYWKQISGFKISDLSKLSRNDFKRCRNFGPKRMIQLDLICDYFKIKLNPTDYENL